jgi:protocatechuate 3,4-dioxygenase beta subunit
MVLAIGLTRRLVTTVFFGDAAEQVSDPLLDCVTNPARRARLFAIHDKSSNSDSAFPVYRFDIVTRGEAETPFFVD